MGRISSLYAIGKTYIKNFFASSQKGVKKSVVIIEQTVKEPKKISSKQIEAYYKRYGKALEKLKPKEVETQLSSEQAIDKSKMAKLQAEMDGYNNRRFLEVSEEALKILEKNFEEKKKKVKEIILADSEILSRQYVSFVKNVSTPKELSEVLRRYTAEYNSGLNIKYSDDLVKLCASKKMSLELQQKVLKEEIKPCDTVLKLLKVVTEPSTDKRVIQAENYLKRMYGMDYVHLESIEEAKNILLTIKLAQKHKIPLPKNIIISPFVGIQMSGQNLTHSLFDYSVVISGKRELAAAKEEAYQRFVSPELGNIVQSLKQQDEKMMSTHDFLHLYIHEFTHSDQVFELLMTSKIKPIPLIYANTIEKLSSYAATSRRELYSELRTKYILDSLNEEEKALFNYFN